MYARDSFFDLSLAGQCGLVALSLLLSIAFLLVARLLLRQWVIWPPRTPAEALALLSLQGPQSLSAHGQALLGWSLLAAPFVRVSRKRRA